MHLNVWNISSPRLRSGPLVASVSVAHVPIDRSETAGRFFLPPLDECATKSYRIRRGHVTLGESKGQASLSTALGSQPSRCRALLWLSRGCRTHHRHPQPEERPAHLHATTTAASRFFERRLSVITRACGSPKMPRTVGCARKPGNEYVSHSRRFRFDGRAIHHSCQIPRPAGIQNPYVMCGFVSPSASKIAHSIPRRPKYLNVHKSPEAIVDALRLPRKRARQGLGKSKL